MSPAVVTDSRSGMQLGPEQSRVQGPLSLLSSPRRRTPPERPLSPRRTHSLSSTARGTSFGAPHSSRASRDGARRGTSSTPGGRPPPPCPKAEQQQGAMRGKSPSATRSRARESSGSARARRSRVAPSCRRVDRRARGRRRRLLLAEVARSAVVVLLEGSGGGWGRGGDGGRAA